MMNTSMTDPKNPTNEPVILHSVDDLKKFLDSVPDGTMIRLNLEVDDDDPDDPGTISIARS